MLISVSSYWLPIKRGLAWTQDLGPSPYLTPDYTADQAAKGPSPRVIHLKCHLPKPGKRRPWGAADDDLAHRNWLIEQRDKLSSEEQRVKATPENLQRVVDDLYDQNGQLKEDARFVYIDCEDFDK